MAAGLRRARWQRHVNALGLAMPALAAPASGPGSPGSRPARGADRGDIQAGAHRATYLNGSAAQRRALRSWLLTGGSLTARLVAHSSAFRVQKLHQRSALCLADEARAIGLRRPGRVWEREVLLRCDGVPVVFAHTVVPVSANASDWPLFSALGERSLGSTLFSDPRVRRGPLEFARLGAGHPLVRRICRELGLGADPAQQGAGEPGSGLAAGLKPGMSLLARRCLYRRRRGVLLVTEVFLPAVADLKMRQGAPDCAPAGQ